MGYGRINSSATLTWNRSRSKSFNFFTNGAPFTIDGVTYSNVNPATLAGIYVGNPTIYSNPFFFGVPSINISGVTGTGVSGIGDSTPSDRINQTISFTDFVSWSHKKHNFRAGLDFHRIHADSIGGTPALGSFTFSGFATENPPRKPAIP